MLKRKQSRDCVCHCEELAQVSAGVMMFYFYISHVFCLPLLYNRFMLFDLFVYVFHA